MKYLGVFLLGLVLAWWVQSIRWDNSVQEKELAWASAQALAVAAVNDKRTDAENKLEADRRTYLEKLKGLEDENAKLAKDTSGDKPPVRVYVKAHCPAAGLPAPSGVPSGTGSGPAELDAASRPDYLALRFGLKKQYEDLQFCRRVLRDRSRPDGS